MELALACVQESTRVGPVVFDWQVTVWPPDELGVQVEMVWQSLRLEPLVSAVHEAALDQAVQVAPLSEEVRVCNCESAAPQPLSVVWHSVAVPTV